MQIRYMLKYFFIMALVQFGFAQFFPGKPWFDTEGNKLEAHGGGILYHEGTYYWYGENKSMGHGNKVGISCYASKDLLHWENKGVVFPKNELPELFRDNGVCERPKVLYNARTQKYVMWMHLDAMNYRIASAGVAISDKPTGPFRFLKHFRPICYPYTNLLPDQDTIYQEAKLGNTFRDMNLFKDTDERAYVFYASENNATMYVSQLNDDYTDIVRPEILGKTWNRILINSHREAPAPFKYKDTYYLITSGLTGWAPNPAQYATAKNILGPYQTKENPCRGFESELTFRSQSTFVLPVPNGKPNQFIFMADRWIGHDITQSSYVWLPFFITEKGDFRLEFYDSWDFSIFDNKNLSPLPPNLLRVAYIANKPVLTWSGCKGAIMYNIYRKNQLIGSSKDSLFPIYTEIGNTQVPYSVVANYGFGNFSKTSKTLKVQMPVSDYTSLVDVMPNKYSQGYGKLMRNKNVDDVPISVNGHAYATGLGTHAPAQLHYHLNGKYSRFTAKVGKTEVPVNGKIKFKILGDGKLLYESRIMDKYSDPERIEISVKFVKKMTLIVEDGGDGIHYDHAVWIEPVLWK